MIEQNYELTKEEENFWYCKKCENQGCDESCNAKNWYEIEELESLFGTSENPAIIKYDPAIQKIIIKTKYVEMYEDTELLRLDELRFVISYIQASQFTDIALFHLKRNE
jgi:hypothetical protein